MKTSNKLLIILASALFILPLVGMVIYAKNTRVDGLAYETGIKQEIENPDATDHFLSSKKVGNFNAVVIDGNGNLYSSISIIKSDQQLIKFDKEKEDFFTTSVDDSGTLHINKNPDKNYSSSKIFIFTPNLDSISLNKLQVSQFETDFDRITMKASQINNDIRFGENKNLKNLDLTIKNSQISIRSAHNTTYNFSDLEDFNLQIVDAKVSLLPSKYKVLRLNLDNSRFNFITEKNRNKSDTVAVENIFVNTLGSSELSIPTNAVKVENIQGSLSDSTITDLPIYLVKDLLNKLQ